MAVLCKNRCIPETRKEGDCAVNSSLQNKRCGVVKEDVEDVTKQPGECDLTAPNLPGCSAHMVWQHLLVHFRSRNAEGDSGGEVRCQFRKGSREMQPQI